MIQTFVTAFSLSHFVIVTCKYSDVGFNIITHQLLGQSLMNDYNVMDFLTREKILIYPVVR